MQVKGNNCSQITEANGKKEKKKVKKKKYQSRSELSDSQPRAELGQLPVT